MMPSSKTVSPPTQDNALPPSSAAKTLRSRRDLYFCLLTLAACAVLWPLDLDTGAKPAPAGVYRARGVVTATDNSDVRVNLIIKTETQFLTVRLDNGPHDGAVLDVDNLLTGKLELDEFYEPGDVILVEYQEVDGQPAHPVARGHYRLRAELFLAALFGLLLLALAGVTGLKALLSFVFTALALWKLLFPLLLKGYPPVALGLAIVALLTAVITLSVGGLNRRGAATFAGSMLGLALTALLATRFSEIFHLHGAIRPYAETLLYSGYLNLSLTQIFVASVFLASSGAVMDLAMDIASAMDEIKAKHPAIGVWEHFRSGMSVGRAVIGTMTTTLLLAYSGSHITMFMLFIGKGLPIERVLNTPLVAAEIMNTLVGSFGLVTVAPFTALVAALLNRKQGRSSS